MRFASIASLVVIAALALSACNLPSVAKPTEDLDAVSTAAAQTIQARLTLQPPAATPTSLLPLPTPTLTPTSSLPTIQPPTAILSTATSICNAATLLDETYLDGTIVRPNEVFTKTWTLKNVGACTWTTSYALVFSTGNAMNGPAALPLSGPVAPGQSVVLALDFTAPAEPGDYTAYYKLRDASGVLFSSFWAQIKVQGTAAFAVTSVDFSTTGACRDFTATADITVNGPGTVTYYWKFSTGAADTSTHDPLVFSAAGTQSVSYTWNTTTPGSYWLDIYIDSPNHEQFGRASFTCP
ncbi:MAG: NBR1-Ig-like domain-containing protein [Bacteroidota bacterium]